MHREMDREICSWVIEFLVRNSVNQMLPKKLIEAFPPLDLEASPRLKKTLLLHSIRSEIAVGNVPETILDHLEMIDCIDLSQSHRSPDSMKKAYCEVALECTAKHLPGSSNRLNYLAAVNRIWMGRIENLEKSKASNLVSEQLRRRRRQVEAAFVDVEVANNLIRTNTRNLAVLALKLYVDEAFDLMGPPLLERVSAVE